MCKISIYGCAMFKKLVCQWVNLKFKYELKFINFSSAARDGCCVRAVLAKPMNVHEQYS